MTPSAARPARIGRDDVLVERAPRRVVWAVVTAPWIRSWLTSPALHFALIGGLLFVALAPDEDAPAPRAQLVIPDYIYESTRREFVDAVGTELSPEQERVLRRVVANEEVLYQYALEIGLNQSDVAERRLAQIAQFVAENPHEAPPPRELADDALEMGLDHGDRVLRNLLVDSATRVIKAAAMIQEPKEALLEAYLRDNRERFRWPLELQLSQVYLGRGMGERDVVTLVERARDASMAPEEAAGLGKRSSLPVRLPRLAERDLARRLGADFARAVVELPVGAWHGPIASRMGDHLVLVEQRWEPRDATLDEVREDVLAEVRRQLADEWLELRLRDLRGRFDIVIAGDVIPEEDLREPIRLAYLAEESR